MTPAAPLSPLTLAVLGLLSQRPLSGYDLRKIFATTSMGHFSSSPGAIYPALERLAKDGLIRGKDDATRELRPKRVFQLTAEGRKVLAADLLRPVERDDVVWRLDCLLLRFSFIGDVCGKARTRLFLRQFLAAVEQYLEALAAQRAEFRRCCGGAAPNGLYALEYGLESYRTTARWIRRVLRELSAD